MKHMWTDSRITRAAKRGRGPGEGTHYRPWLEAQEVSSLGRPSRYSKAGRIHHFLSNVESEVHALLAFDPDVIDMREQFPVAGGMEGQP